MGQFLEVLIFVIAGAALLWFGYTLFLRLRIAARGDAGKEKENSPKGEGKPGDPQVCPVCSAKLDSGQLVSSAAFPSLNGAKDRIMHIRGCAYCLAGKRERVCPVCGAHLEGDEVLVCRLFERTIRRSHVHVLGCSHCKSRHIKPKPSPAV